MENIILLILTLDPKTWVNQILYLVAKHQCFVEESRCSVLGTEWGGSLRISGNWNTLAKLEDALTALQNEQPGLWLKFKRSPVLKLTEDHMPYLLQIVAVNTPNLLNDLTLFLVEQDIQLIDFQTDAFKSNYSETKLLNLLMRVHIPATINISELRERFMLLCEDLNADGILEPEKSIK